jgi:hypothetical protein
MTPTLREALEFVRPFFDGAATTAPGAHECLRKIDAALNAGEGHTHTEPNGWQLVPKTPTEKMLLAAYATVFNWPDDWAGYYQACIAAAPKYAGEGPVPSTLAASHTTSPSASPRGEPAPELELNAATAALVALAEHNIPADMQEVLVLGSRQKGIQPGALSKAVKAILLSFSPHNLDPETVERWQPIETAPKDGTRIVLAKYVGHPDHISSLWWMTLGFWSSRWQNWNDGIEPSGLADPTHWMPLPPAPALSKANEQSNA